MVKYCVKILRQPSQLQNHQDKPKKKQRLSLTVIYQLLLLIALFLAMFFQRNWSERRILFGIVFGALILIDGLIVTISYLFVKNHISGLGYLDYPFKVLPLVVPVLAWFYAEKKIRSRYDNN